MLTFRGWLCLGVAVGFFVAAPFFAPVELNVLGATLVALVASMAAYVALASGRVAAARHLHPERVHVGAAARVDLVVRNVGRRPTVVATARDDVEGTEGASLVVPRLGPGQVARGAYQLPTGRRGPLVVGPLRLTRTDPFGLVARRSVLVPARRVVVHPRYEHVAPVPRAGGRDAASAARATSATAQGEELYALRPYVVGDDLRRVDWRASARHDELVVRQDEPVQRGRATVVLDVRAGLAPAPAFERMVSAAAGLVAASGRGGDAVRLVTGDGDASALGTGPRHVAALLDRLALVQPTAAALPPAEAAGAGAGGAGAGAGAVVLVVADLVAGDAAGLLPLTLASPFVAVVRLAPGGPARVPPGVEVVDVGPGDAFGAAWDQVVARRSRHRVGAGR